MSKRTVSIKAVSAAVLSFVLSASHAQEQASVDSLNQTTTALIQALVERGVISKETADGLIKSNATKTPTEAPAKAVQRIPYISDSVRNQIRDEIKEEITQQARMERWGVANAVPAWVDRIKLDGDIRYRYQSDRPDGDNTPATLYTAAMLDGNQGIIRSPEYGVFDSVGQSTTSTTDDRARQRVRLRLGVTAKVSDEVGVGVRLASGSTTDRVSTNQTLGQDFNKYQILIDRAFVRLTPAEGVDLSLGRIANPWFNTDMIWSDNLNFEGVAASWREVDPNVSLAPYATVGAFPLREGVQPRVKSRWLYGVQAGAAWSIESRTRVKFGLAYYRYQNIEGREDTDYATSGSTFVPGTSFGQYAYRTGLAQKGNTLFETNPSLSGVTGVPLTYGLAYQFRPVVATVSAELTHFSPFSLLMTAEYVRNTAFSQQDFARRAGASFAGYTPGGDDKGYHLRLGLGALDVREQGDWQVSMSFKRVGSDAVLDAFTDSDLGLGGTNVKGYTLAMQYGLYRNTVLGARFLSGKSIDSPINDFNSDAKFGVSSMQLDLNVKF